MTSQTTAGAPPRKPAATRPGNSRQITKFIRWAFTHFWLVIVAFAAWWFLSAGSTNIFVPPLSRILEVLWRDLMNGVILGHIGYTLTNLALGLSIALIVGILGGILIGERAVVRETSEPIIHFIRSIPQAALVPLVIGAFGIGMGPKVMTIALACVWPILLNTIDGVRAVDATARSMSRVYRIPKTLYFRRVVLSSALPQILAGVRVSLAIGVTVMVVAELFGADRGLGYYILNSSATFKIAESWGGALLVGLIGYLLNLAFLAFESVTLRWYFASGSK
ncbi:ABC transporter permease [Arthrobacter sp. Edens01]|uniref:ABC transporter permease n=1 Tax=Arthrobacter sp. Edens01 TaxID=1732020 RepID=UPI0009E73DD1|nr:ABC transporter permease [Arthrobacter sp. Edens01]